MKKFDNMSQYEYIQYVENDDELGFLGLGADQYKWEYIESFSVNELLNEMSNTGHESDKNKWIEWLNKEQEKRINDLKFDSIQQIENYWLESPQVEPLIVVRNKENNIELWDGFHRLGISIKHLLSNVPVVFGTEIK